MHWACEFLQSRRALAMSDEQVKREKKKRKAVRGKRRMYVLRTYTHQSNPTNPSLHKPTKKQNQIRDEIRGKFTAANAGSSSSGAAASVSFAPIARTADAVRRRGLATMLLDLEPVAASQVCVNEYADADAMGGGA